MKLGTSASSGSTDATAPLSTVDNIPPLSSGQWLTLPTSAVSSTLITMTITSLASSGQTTTTVTRVSTSYTTGTIPYLSSLRISESFISSPSSQFLGSSSALRNSQSTRFTVSLPTPSTKSASSLGLPSVSTSTGMQTTTGPNTSSVSATLIGSSVLPTISGQIPTSPGSSPGFPTASSSFPVSGSSLATGTTGSFVSFSKTTSLSSPNQSATSSAPSRMPTASSITASSQIGPTSGSSPLITQPSTLSGPSSDISSALTSTGASSGGSSSSASEASSLGGTSSPMESSVNPSSSTSVSSTTTEQVSSASSQGTTMFLTTTIVDSGIPPRPSTPSFLNSTSSANLTSSLSSSSNQRSSTRSTSTLKTSSLLLSSSSATNPSSSTGSPIVTSFSTPQTVGPSSQPSDGWNGTILTETCTGTITSGCVPEAGKLMTKMIAYGNTVFSFVFPTPDITTTVSYWTGMYPTLTGPDWTSLPLTTRTIRQTPPSQLPSFSLFKPTPSTLRTTIATRALAGLEKRAEDEVRVAAEPTSCGESGNFTLNFDDTTVSGGDGGILPVSGLKNPYHHLFYANGFTYMPDKWEPYPAVSQPNVAVFLPIGTSLLPASPFAGTLLPGELGAGPRASVDAYWFNAYSGFFGCALNGVTPCALRISGYRYDSTLKQEVLAVEQNVTIPPCWGYINCKMTQVAFNPNFRELSGIQFNAFTNKLGIPQMFMMDDLQLEWYNNSCSAGILRIGHS